MTSDEARKYPKALLYMTADFEDRILKFYDTVYAIADPDEHNSMRVLERAGFIHQGRDQNGELFKWQRQSPTQ